MILAKQKENMQYSDDCVGVIPFIDFIHRSNFLNSCLDVIVWSNTTHRRGN